MSHKMNGILNHFFQIIFCYFYFIIFFTSIAKTCSFIELSIALRRILESSRHLMLNINLRFGYVFKLSFKINPIFTGNFFNEHFELFKELNNELSKKFKLLFYLR